MNIFYSFDDTTFILAFMESEISDIKHLQVWGISNI
jgi:hypothetical protein